MNKILQPKGWAQPKGYANGISATGRHVFVAGQIGWNSACAFEASDFLGQFRQALANVLAILAEAGGAPEHVTSMTWFITDKAAYLRDAKAVGQAWREMMGRNYPAMAVVQVVALMEDAALIEIQAQAVLPS
ncbi:MAG: RidA family protein [Hyphomicrobiales bacterium]|nr:RidA family protein [Hyphomicrobiales bacterium]